MRAKQGEITSYMNESGKSLVGILFAMSVTKMTDMYLVVHTGCCPHKKNNMFRKCEDNYDDDDASDKCYVDDTSDK